MRDIRISMVFLFIAVITAFAYRTAPGNGFVWDDVYLIKNNPLVRAPILAPYRFTQDLANSYFQKSDYYRPLQLMSYAADYRLFRFNPAGYHITNIILHIVNAFLVFLLVLRICGRWAVAFMTAALFSVFAADVSSVAYIAGRADLLYFMFGILSVYFFLLLKEKAEKRYLWLSLSMLILSILSKEAALIFPFITLIADMVFFREGKRAYKYHVIAFGMLIFYWIIRRYVFLSVPAMTPGGGTLTLFLRYLPAAIVYNIRPLLYPFGIHMRYSAAQPDVYGYIGAAILLIFAAAGIFYAKRYRKALIFSLCVFIISLFPFAYAASIQHIIGQHWVYLSDLPLFMVLIITFYAFAMNGSMPRRVIMSAVFAGLIILHMNRVMAQTIFWRSDTALSGSIMRFEKNDTAAERFKYIESSGTEKNGNMTEPGEEGARLHGNDPVTLAIKGNVYLKRGLYREARRSFEKALRVGPRYDEAYMGLARIDIAEKHYKDAIAKLKKAISVNPRNYKAIVVLVPLLDRSGDPKKALEFAKTGFRLNPYQYNTVINLGTAYIRTGDLDKGLSMYRRAVRLYPENPLTYYNLASIYHFIGDKERADKWISMSLKKDPSFAPSLKLRRSIK